LLRMALHADSCGGLLTMSRKTIIGADTGRGIDLLKGAKGIDQPAYSKAVRLDLPGFTWIMVSGVVALDDALQVVGEGNLREQTRFVLQTIKSDLESQGAGMDDICRVRVYLTDISAESFRVVHEERAKFFSPAQYPASTLVKVAGLIKPELLIEIDADVVVLRGGGDCDTK
jgi:enamine deaminase RidA (YjgF/YER057c/UK114 family)